MGGLKFIKTVAPFLDKEGFINVIALRDYRTKPLIPISGNCELSFMHLEELAIGYRRLDMGNPATDKAVKDYLRVATMEQLQARVQPKQATPFFNDKLDRLVIHIEQSMKSPSISPTQRFILARDQAYFKAVFFSGDRPGDMGKVKVPEILRFPNNDGLLFNHVWGKTLRDGNSNIFGIQRNPQSNLCPVRGHF